MGSKKYDPHTICMSHFFVFIYTYATAAQVKKRIKSETKNKWKR